MILFLCHPGTGRCLANDPSEQGAMLRDNFVGTQDHKHEAAANPAVMSIR
jgi:hypothetical protein